MQAALDNAPGAALPMLWKRGADRQYMMRSEKRPNYRRSGNGRRRKPPRRVLYAIVTVLLLLLIWPIGLILLWRRRLRWRAQVKGAVTVATGVLFLLGFSLLLTAPTQNDAVLTAQNSIRSSMTSIAESIDRAAQDSGRIGENAGRIASGATSVGKKFLLTALPAGKANADALMEQGERLAISLTKAGLRGVKQALYATGAAPTPSPSPTPAPTPSPSPTPAPTPEPSPAVQMVWRAQGDALYHNDPTCGGMIGAEEITLAKALDEALMPCEVCVLEKAATPAPTDMPLETAAVTISQAEPSPTPPEGFSARAVAPEQTASDLLASDTTPQMTSSPSTSPSPAPTPSASPTAAPLPTISATKIVLPAVKPMGEMLVWHTANGRFYHLDENCPGMSGAKQHTLASSVEDGFKPCTRCKPPAPEILEEVLAVWGGTDHVFHITDECEALTKTWSAFSFESALLEEGYAGCAECGADLFEQSAKSPVSTPAPAEPSL